ncbi:MAG: acyl-CoA synthetase [Parvibaculum sp.]|uniref:acyl-CoA synthetase n=1 Tax=Parvibaculum sp. TaxID=2024848 RepID=UPI003C759D75
MKRHFAALWEVISDAIPDEIAIVNGDTRRSWREYEGRAGSLAAALVAAGLRPDAKIGLYAYNSNEYLEAHFAAFKARGVPINVNYRYVEEELTYLLDNADAEALFFDAQFGTRVAAIRSRLPKLKLLVEIDDGSGEHLDGALRYEDVIAAHRPLPRGDYSEDDIYMLYTGGTTGMPKGVMYRQGDFAEGLMLGYDLRGLPRPQTRDELTAAVRELRAAGAAPVSMAACPLMHGTGMWLGVMIAHNLGGTAVTFRNTHFDPDELWRLVERERVSDVAIVGDAFAKPMLLALEGARDAGRPYDLTSLKTLISSGVMFTREVKQGLLDFADIAIIDAMGSTEGSMGMSVVSRELPPSETARFLKNETTKVFTDDGREVTPGSDEIGMIANGGFAPIGYYKDPAKSAATFRVVNGHRYSFPGDYAKVAADGSLILLGRGSVCINTGGEKVFPEEVEEALKAHPAVYDCLVVGLPDDRFGERVTAVLSRRPGHSVEDQELISFARTRLAGYKMPRQIVLVDEVRRAPNGKADYKWAKAVAVERAV